MFAVRDLYDTALAHVLAGWGLSIRMIRTDLVQHLVVEKYAAVGSAADD